MIELFNTLGTDIEQQWSAARRNCSRFPEIASSALAKHGLAQRLDHAGLVHAALRAAVLPPQSDSRFGQPPLIVHVGTDFYIEVLTWLEATTCIHQHNFCGAFQVLAGSSLHTTHSFEEQERISQRLLVGDLRVKGSERLLPGDVREIHSGAALIHALFHLDHPSATIVVRTKDDGTGPQYQYAPPHLAFDPLWKPGNFAKQIALLELLVAIHDPRLDDALADLVSGSDAWSAWQLLVFANHRAHGSLERLLETTRRRHGTLVDVIAPSLEEDRRQANIVLRRAAVIDPTHRFFLALLLNLPDRPSIFRAIADRYPDVSPADWVVEQVRQLGVDRQLGLSFDPVSLAVLQRLLLGNDDDAIRVSFEKAHGRNAVRSQAGLLKQLGSQIRQALLLRPLFA